MPDWLIRLIPVQWKWDIAAKKMTYWAGKGTVALLMYGKVKTLLGSHLTPDQVVQVQGAAAILAGALLEGIHDWAKLQWPENPWL